MKEKTFKEIIELMDEYNRMEKEQYNEDILMSFKKMMINLMSYVQFPPT